MVTSFQRQFMLIKWFYLTRNHLYKFHNLPSQKGHHQCSVLFLPERQQKAMSEQQSHCHLHFTPLLRCGAIRVLVPNMAHPVLMGQDRHILEHRQHCLCPTKTKRGKRINLGSFSKKKKEKKGILSADMKTKNLKQS